MFRKPFIIISFYFIRILNFTDIVWFEKNKY